MLVAGALLASAWQSHGALRPELSTAHTSRARPILARDDDLVFSRRKMEATLAEARYEVSRELEEQAEQKSSGSCPTMPSLMKQYIVGYQLAWTLGSLLLFAEVFAHLAHVPPPVVSLLDPRLALNGVLVGIPSAVIVSRLERWRSDASSAASPSGSSAALADRRQIPAGVTYVPARLTQFATPTLQLVFLPVRPFYPFFAETSGKQVIAQQPAMAAYTWLILTMTPPLLIAQQPAMTFPGYRPVPGDHHLPPVYHSIPGYHPRSSSSSLPCSLRPWWAAHWWAAPGRTACCRPAGGLSSTTRRPGRSGSRPERGQRPERGLMEALPLGPVEALPLGPRPAASAARGVPSQPYPRLVRRCGWWAREVWQRETWAALGTSPVVPPPSGRT